MAIIRADRCLLYGDKAVQSGFGSSGKYVVFELTTGNRLFFLRLAGDFAIAAPVGQGPLTKQAETTITMLKIVFQGRFW